MQTNLQTEAELIDAARAGSADALAALYTAHAQPVFALAWRLTGSRADAEDVLHDVFLGLPEGLRRYVERGNFGAWLRRVAARTALMRMRSGRRRREVELDEAGDRAVDPPGDGEVAQDLWRAVADLPDGLRAVFVLKEVEGHTHAEVATLLGITSGASEVRLCRAMRKLRERLEGSR
ncbi:MAG TPA: sigma-70 family RNA polymerase sigma factor [Longimicrobiaceae bacterium]